MTRDIVEAAKAGHIDAVRELIPSASRKSLGKAFHWAVKRDHQEIALLLLAHDAPIKDKTFREAIAAGATSIVAQILRRKSRFNLDMDNAVVDIVVADELDIVRLLMEHEVEFSVDLARLAARRVGNTAAIQLLSNL